MTLVENYKEIKDIEVNYIGKYGNNERREGILYEKGKVVPFSGVVIKRNKDKMIFLAGIFPEQTEYTPG